MKIERTTALGTISIVLTEAELRSAYEEVVFNKIKENILDAADAEGIQIPETFSFGDVVGEIQHRCEKNEDITAGYWDAVREEMHNELDTDTIAEDDEDEEE